MLKLQLQYFGHLMRRADSFEKTLMLGNTEGRRRRGQRMRRSNGITDSMDMGLGRLRELVMDREAWHATVHGFAKCRTWLNDWTELNLIPWLSSHFPSLHCGGKELATMTPSVNLHTPNPHPLLNSSQNPWQPLLAPAIPCCHMGSPTHITPSHRYPLHSSTFMILLLTTTQTMQPKHPVLRSGLFFEVWNIKGQTGLHIL